MVEESRRFIALPVVKPTFTLWFERVADELTSRREEEGMLRTIVRYNECEGQQMRTASRGRGLPRFLSSHLQRRCRVEEGRGGNVRSSDCKNKESTMQPIQRSRERARKAKAKDQGLNYCELGSAQQIEARCQVRMAPWEAHMRNPAAALKKALRRTEERAPSRRRVQGNACPSISSQRWCTMHALTNSERLVSNLKRIS